MERRSARAWLLEISLAVLAMLLGLFFLSQSVSEGDGAPLEVEAVAGVLSFAGLVLFRRSHPVALTLVLIPFGILLGMSRRPARGSRIVAAVPGPWEPSRRLRTVPHFGHGVPPFGGSCFPYTYFSAYIGGRAAAKFRP